MGLPAQPLSTNAARVTPQTSARVNRGTIDACGVSDLTVPLARLSLVVVFIMRSV